MNALAFDTLADARRLEVAGFSRQQAEALAEEQAKLIDGRLATRADIGAINANIESLRLATKADLAETKADILEWMIGSVGIQTIVILGAITALVRLAAH